jgi:hypothetical protein
LAQPAHEQRSNSLRQCQRGVRPLLQGLVNGNRYVVANFAHCLDGFSSLVLGIGDDTSDIAACRHG